ncbi:hypothetical protein KI387_006212, partial [Taxus chinensis]
LVGHSLGIDWGLTGLDTGTWVGGTTTGTGNSSQFIGWHRASYCRAGRYRAGIGAETYRTTIDHACIRLWDAL